MGKSKSWIGKVDGVFGLVRLVRVGWGIGGGFRSGCVVGLGSRFVTSCDGLAIVVTNHYCSISCYNQNHF